MKRKKKMIKIISIVLKCPHCQRYSAGIIKEVALMFTSVCVTCVPLFFCACGSVWLWPVHTDICYGSHLKHNMNCQTENPIWAINWASRLAVWMEPELSLTPRLKLLSSIPNIHSLPIIIHEQNAWPLPDPWRLIKPLNFHLWYEHRWNPPKSL